MSFYIGSALQLFGRPWDKLYHVLVSPDFETNQQFFYKPKEDTVIERRCPDGSTRQLNTRDAEVQLAELPLIILGEKLSLKGKGFRELIAEGQREWDTATFPPALRVNLIDRTICVGDTLIERISPVQLMIYVAFLRQKIDHCKQPERLYCLGCTDCFIFLDDLSSSPAFKVMADDYNKLYGGQTEKIVTRFKLWIKQKGISEAVLRSNRSKINSAIREQLHDDRILQFYEVISIGKRGTKKYGVRVEKRKIRIE